MYLRLIRRKREQLEGLYRKPGNAWDVVSDRVRMKSISDQIDYYEQKEAKWRELLKKNSVQPFEKRLIKSGELKNRSREE